MDEPFGPLDAQTRTLMGEMLLDLWSRNRKAVMFVTHDLEEAISLADRVVVMAAGPESNIIGRYDVTLERPRDPAEIRHTAEFGAIHKEIWQTLKKEVVKAYVTEDRA
jgi:NitT/TauT family transport system ATP-binding protein